MRNQRPKTFVTPGVLAYNQYGPAGRFGGNGGGYPLRPWQPPGPTLPALRWAEPWTEYAAGQFSVTAATNWVSQNYLFGGAAAYGTGAPANQLTVSGVSLTSMSATSGGILPPIDTTQNWGIRANIVAMAVGSQAQGTNDFSMNVVSLAGGFSGFRVVNDDVNGCIVQMTWANGGGTTTTNFVQPTGLFSGQITVTVFGTTQKIYLNNTLLGTQTVVQGTLTGSVNLGVDSWNRGLGGISHSIGTLVAYNG